MLEARQIDVSYGRREVLRNVSVAAAEGQVTCVIGPNGSGKSTLMGALNGSVPITHGEVLLDGRPLASLARRLVSRRLAVVAQESELRFPVTVLEFVLGGRYAWSSNSSWGWETARDVDFARQALSETSMETFDSRLMNELSGGERQRAVVARALAGDAAILLLDEPTANLDLAHQSSILALIRRRCDLQGMAAIFVTHDISLGAEYADEILLLKAGEAVGSGAPRDVLTPNLLQKVFEVEVLVDDHPVTGAPRITPVHRQHRERPITTEEYRREGGSKPPLPAQL